MINLMPPARKEDILFARRNSFLIRWMVSIGLAVTGLAIITGGSLFYLKQDSRNYQSSIDDTKAQLKQQDQEETLQQVNDMGANFNLVVNVLSREVLFSKLLQYIGNIMPEGTVLQNLSLSRDNTNGLQLSIGAVDYERASQALVNLQAAENLLFSGADANKIDCENSPEGSIYTCTATIQTVLTEDNPFLLLNQGESSEQ